MSSSSPDSTPCTVVSWNLKGSAGVDAGAVAGVIASFGPEVVCLQEVRKFQARRLAAALRMHARWYFKHWSPTHGGEGLAVLSATAPRDVHRVVLTPGVPHWSWRRRIAVIATIDVGGAALRVADVHLAVWADADPRAEQGGLLLAALGDAARDDATAAPVVVAGDLNALPGEEVYVRFQAAGLRDTWLDVAPSGPSAGAEGGAAVPSGATAWSSGRLDGRPADQRIDYVLAGTLRSVRPGTGEPRSSSEAGGGKGPGPAPVTVAVVDVVVPDPDRVDRAAPPGFARLRELSDHLPIAATLRLERHGAG